MAKQIGDLTALATLSDADFLLVRDSAAGVDKKMTGSSLIGQIDRQYSAENTNFTITDSQAARNPVYGVTTGASTLTGDLPTLADNVGNIITFVKEDSGAGTITMDGEGSETINGALAITLRNQGDWVTVIATATEWYIIGRSTILRSTATGITLDVFDDIVICTPASGITLTLPTSAAKFATRQPFYWIKRTAAGVITIDGDSSETIDDKLTINLSRYDGAAIYADGTEWWLT